MKESAQMQELLYRTILNCKTSEDIAALLSDLCT